MKDNKYQEALDRIKDIQRNLIALNGSGRLNKHRTDDLKVMNRATIKLQELVDKETPMMPIYSTNHQNGYCPVCPTIIYRGDPRCYQCGQKLDWTEE